MTWLPGLEAASWSAGTSYSVPLSLSPHPQARHRVAGYPQAPLQLQLAAGSRASRARGSLTRVQAARLGAAVRGCGAGQRVRVGVGEPGGLRLPGPTLVVAGLDGIGSAPAAAHPPVLRARPAAARLAAVAAAQPGRRSSGPRGGGGGSDIGPLTARAAASAGLPGAPPLCLQGPPPLHFPSPAPLNLASPTAQPPVPPSVFWQMRCNRVADRWWEEEKGSLFSLQSTSWAPIHPSIHPSSVHLCIHPRIQSSTYLSIPL